MELSLYQELLNFLHLYVHNCNGGKMVTVRNVHGTARRPVCLLGRELRSWEMRSERRWYLVINRNLIFLGVAVS